MKSTDEKVYEIFKTVFYSPEYSKLAARYREKENRLFLLDGHVTDEQAQIINDYVAVIMEAHEAMLRIAVENQN